MKSIRFKKVMAYPINNDMPSKKKFAPNLNQTKIDKCLTCDNENCSGVCKKMKN